MLPAAVPWAVNMGLRGSVQLRGLTLCGSSDMEPLSAEPNSI